MENRPEEVERHGRSGVRCACQQREVQPGLDRQAEAERAGHSSPIIPALLPKVEDPPSGFLHRTLIAACCRSVRDDAGLFFGREVYPVPW